MQRNLSFDVVRGGAIFLVVANHLSALMFKNVPVSESSFIQILFSYLTGFGHLAVIIFLVLSGFLIHKNNMNKLFDSISVFKSFILKRYLRLSIVLLPALLITICLDYTGYNYGSENIYVAAYDYNGMIGHNFHNSLNIYSFLATVFYLNDLIPVYSFGSNTPLWYLSVQFWCYVLYGLIKFINGNRKKNLFLSILLGVIFGLIVYFIMWGKLVYTFCFLIGCVVARLSENKQLNRRPLFTSPFFLSLIIVLCFVFRVVDSKWSGSITDIVFSLISGCLILLLAIRKSDGLEANPCLRKVISFFSGFSFTLYCVHFPIVICLVSLFFQCPPLLELSLITFCEWCFVMIGTYAVSYLLYLAFEKNSYKIISKII